MSISWYIIQLLHAVRWSRGCHFPSRVYKTHGPQSQRATIVLLYLCIIMLFLFSKFCCHLQTLLRRTIHCLISRRTRNNSLEPAVDPYTARNRPTLGTIKVMYTGVHHFSCYPARREPCNMRFLRHMIGSRPIKLHSLLQRYNKYTCCSHIDNICWGVTNSVLHSKKTFWNKKVFCIFPPSELVKSIIHWIHG